MKILNLYAGIGGNRNLWGDEHEITAVEFNEDIAKMYKRKFPNDTLIIGDAKEYLLMNYNKYDFIWASPPCQSHTALRINWAQSKDDVRRLKPMFPDLSLYEEIIFLDGYFKGKYCIENVIPYYKPLIEGKKIGRHYFWANFNIGNFKTKHYNIITGNPLKKAKELGYDLTGAKYRKDTMVNNMVDDKLGQYILDCAMGIIRQNNVNQNVLKL